MKLEIKLKDPKYCDGCPCLEMQYNKELLSLKGHCSKMKMYLLDWNFDTGDTIRPQICIKQNGK